MIRFGFSLLWPDNETVRRSDRSIRSLPQQTVKDLGIDAILPHIVQDKKRVDGVRTLLTQLCGDRTTIEYRLEILEDLVTCPRLVEVLESLVPTLSELRYYVHRPDMLDWTELQEVAFRLRELEHYARCVRILTNAFGELSGSLCSRGLTQLGELVWAIADDPMFRNLEAELPALLAVAASPGSITIGVNLTSGMVPGEAVLLSVNEERFSGQGLFGRIAGNGEWDGIAPIHSSSTSETYANPMMVPLFQDLSKIQRKTTAPLALALRTFVSLNSRLFVSLQDEILFFLGAVDMIRSLRARGLPMCRPRIADAAERVFQAEGLYNLNLALRSKDEIVANDLALGGPTPADSSSATAGPRIAVVTGPNSGGKTTFLEAVGLAQILAQVGLYVPAESARISLCDTVLTHYPALEETGRSAGRFGEEASRLGSLFDSVTCHSLVLLNETLSSTAMGESVYIGMDMLGVLRQVGCRAVYVTHLHQLAEDANRINAEVDGDADVFSVVATVTDQASPAYQFVVAPPDGKSYAARLAERYGIDRVGLLERLATRGVPREAVPAG